MMTRARLIPALAVLCAAFVLTAAKPKDKVLDLFWTHPEIARFEVRQVAMLPVVTFDRNLQTSYTVERAWGQQFARSGHRWRSAAFARDRLRAAAGGGDSLLKGVDEQVRRGARVDSLGAPGLARVLHARTLLSVRVDAWEKVELQPTQRGRATTFVWLKAALVDSTGALLWTVSGSERLEGADYDPAAANLGLRPGELGSRPVATAAVAAPRFEEVLAKLMARWAPHFPPPPAEAAPVPAVPEGSPAPAPADSASSGG